MRLTFIGLLLGMIVASLASMSSLMAVFNVGSGSLLFAAIASVLIIFLGRLLTGNFTNFMTLFLVFGMLYGLSGPFAAMYGQGLSAVFPRPYLVEEFLLHYSLAIVGFTIGLIMFSSIKNNTKMFETDLPVWNSQVLMVLTICFAMLASFMEILNFTRAGGWEVFLSGKAKYQSAVSELTGTLPSEMIMFLSVALLGLTLSQLKSTKKKLINLFLWILPSLPLLANWLVLGRRRPLLAVVLIFVIAIYFTKPVKVLRIRWIIIGLCLYIIFSGLYGVRGSLGNAFATGDFNPLISRITEHEFWISVLNPANNEFGSPFGNFNTHLLLKSLDAPRYGETYLTGLTIPIPRFIWEDKPQSITYEFRDTYFMDWGERGTISGTAFSSILEAYINFGTIGVVVVYFILGLTMTVLERIRLSSKSLAFTIFYLMLIPETIRFHRSSLEMPLFWPFILTLVGFFSYVILNSFILNLSRKVMSFRGLYLAK